MKIIKFCNYLHKILPNLSNYQATIAFEVNEILAASTFSPSIIAKNEDLKLYLQYFRFIWFFRVLASGISFNEMSNILGSDQVNFRGLRGHLMGGSMVVRILFIKQRIKRLFEGAFGWHKLNSESTIVKLKQRNFKNMCV